MRHAKLARPMWTLAAQIGKLGSLAIRAPVSDFEVTLFALLSTSSMLDKAHHEVEVTYSKLITIRLDDGRRQYRGLIAFRRQLPLA